MPNGQLKIKILFFASIRDKSGCSNMELFIPSGFTIRTLKLYLIEKFSSMDPGIFHAVSSINNEFAFDTEIVPEGAEVAFFPPVSGGKNQIDVSLTYKPININRLVKKISGKETGGICIFTGVVREVSNDLITTSIDYQAYTEMAQLKMHQIGEEILERWPMIQKVFLVQRLGKVLPMEPSTVILCAAAHRNDGIFKGAQYGIDRLKQIAPIWKKEFCSTGKQWVEGSYYPRPGD